MRAASKTRASTAKIARGRTTSRPSIRNPATGGAKPKVTITAATSPASGGRRSVSRPPMARGTRGIARGASTRGAARGAIRGEARGVARGAMRGRGTAVTIGQLQRSDLMPKLTTLRPDDKGYETPAAKSYETPAAEGAYTPNAQLHGQLNELISERKRLNHRLVSSTHAFTDVLIYCKKTIENQDYQIERLEEGLRRCEDVYEEKLRKERSRTHEEMAGMKLMVDRIDTECLMMKTQLGNLEQLELELQETHSRVDGLQKELKEKNEKISERAIKDRELIILTTEKVRKELTLGFDQEIEKIKRELQLQNRAQSDANEQLAKKAMRDLKKVEIDKENHRADAGRLREELNAQTEKLEGVERAKAKADDQLRTIDELAAQRVAEVQKQLDTLQDKLGNSLKNYNMEHSKQTAEIEALNERIDSQTKQLVELAANLDKERKSRFDATDKLYDQNGKVLALKHFLHTVFEANNDHFIDMMLGENRAAIFAKITTLVKSIPVLNVQEEETKNASPQLKAV